MKNTTLLLSIILLACCSPFRSEGQEKTPTKAEIIEKATSFLKWENKHNKTRRVAKPTGERQRLVRTLAQTGMPSGPFYTNNDIYFTNSGNRGSSTSLHGPYTYSEYDSGYSITNQTYQSQKFYPDDKLKRGVTYFDMSYSSGPGSNRYEIKDYDEKGRLILDSLKQSGQIGSNLAITNWFTYDVNDRLSYLSYAFNSYETSGFNYKISIWKNYLDTSKLPITDSIVLNDENVTTTKIVKHFYDVNDVLIADSTYEIIPPFFRNLVETTAFTYPQTNTQIALTRKPQNNVWNPFTNIMIKTDNEGRQTLIQQEDYENGAWVKLYKSEREYTYTTQPDSIPTLQYNYNSNGLSWNLMSKERRTFDNFERVDTLYTYVASGTIDNSTVPCFTVYTYNSFGNLAQNYTHNFIPNGQEVNGYYTNYYYEVYDDPLSVTKVKEEDLTISCYPNPTKDLVNISILNKVKTPIQIIVTDIMGSEKLSQNMNTNSLAIDLSSLTPGLYLFKAIDKSGSSKTFKVIKQ